jgi:nucleoid DNA-binding protein
MTYVETVEQLARTTGVSKAKVRDVLREFFGIVETQAILGSYVRVPHFGKFSRRVVKSGKSFGHNFDGHTTVKLKSYIRKPLPATQRAAANG